MITLRIAASITPASVERTQHIEAAPRPRPRRGVPQVLRKVRHPHVHLPHRHA